MNVQVMIDSIPALLGGTLLTLKLVAVASAIGFVLALGVTAMRLSGRTWLVAPSYAYVFFLRGTPLLVQIYLVYYGLSQFPEIRQSVLWPFLREPWWCALIAFSMNTSAYVSEVMRGAITAVPLGQIEAAKAIGMPALKRFHKVVAPQAMQIGLPAYSNEIILMVKASSLASTVTLLDLTGVARSLASETYMPVEVLGMAGIIYLILNFILTRILRGLEWFFSPRLKSAPGILAKA
ncbi:MAG: ABC transporter permease [Shinella sp.]|uniref:ABC transporter permease n=1 Tax=Shinella sp. TaxID=1870904 RepID=UPI003C773EAE